MDNCKLCNKNIADKKGSHIVPHFLLKRIENIDEKKERGYELGFMIDRLKTSSYFGRSVQPEKLEDVYGEVSDEDIDSNKHPLVVDYFFCTECEKRLGVIEDEYAKTIENVKEEEYESGVDSSVGILFWGSILWRMSINGKSGVKLDEKQNEYFRELLDTFLPNSFKELKIDELKESSIAKSISYKLLRCNNCHSDDAKWVFFHPEFYNPLCLLLDEFVLIYSINDQYSDIERIDCFGINELIKKSPINRISGKEKITPFDNIIYKQIADILKMIMVKEYTKNLDKFFDAIHVAIGGQGQIMPIEIKGEILAELIFVEKKKGKKIYNGGLKKFNNESIKEIHAT